MVYLKGIFVNSTILFIVSIILISLSNAGYAKIAYKKPIYNKSNLIKEKRYKIKQEPLKINSITTTTAPQMDECRISETTTTKINLNDEQQPKKIKFNDNQQETTLTSTLKLSSSSSSSSSSSPTNNQNNNSPLEKLNSGDIDKPTAIKSEDLIEDTEMPVFSTFNNNHNDIDVTNNNNANNNNDFNNNDVDNKQLKKLHEKKQIATTTAAAVAATTSSSSSSSSSSTTATTTTTTTAATESNLPVPCTCGIFLTSQLRLGQPIEKPIITNELERTYSCNVIGQKQCQTKCLETIVQHLPNSASIICATLNRDCRKERAYLYIKNCRNHWINTTLTAGRDYCCKDGQPFTCPLI